MKAKFFQLQKNRMIILLEILSILFVFLGIRLYQIQIIQGKEHLEDIRITTYRTIPISASRGNIYDRWGVPLAENKVSYSVNLDLSVSVENLNDFLLNLFQVFDETGEIYLDDFPMTKEEPYEFIFSSNVAEKRWKKDMGFRDEELEWDAEQIMGALKEKFQVPKFLSPEKMRRLISARASIYMQRFKKYNSILLARNISQKTIAKIEEQSEKYPAVFIEPQTERNYPQGEAFSHILGYIGNINEEELKEYTKYEYTDLDVIGKLGIEKAYELTLHGTNGKRLIEVDALGKRMNEIKLENPIQGGDVFLTIDSRLQNKTAEIVKENLKEAFYQKYQTGEIKITQILQSVINSNVISLEKIWKAEETQTQYQIKKLLLEKNPFLDIKTEEEREEMKNSLISLILKNKITALQILQCFQEQGKITIDEKLEKQMQNGQRSVESVFIEKIMSDEIPIQELNLDPCTGSVVVLDVNTGEVLSLVSFPSYDNNQLVNQFNIEYYNKLLNNPNTPLINRPLMERKAPGSVLKMVMAVAGLETEVINENTNIYDYGIYKEAGKPYAKCLVYSRYGITHGATDVRKALEVSCNYFFYELAYRFGNAKEGTTLNSIKVMGEYMQKFGLNKNSGIEIEETNPKVATPEEKAFSIENYYDDAKESQKRWMDGDSIRCAIGQSYNSFSAIHIAKYIATLANGGSRMKTSIIKGVRDKGESNFIMNPPVLEENLQLKSKTVQIVKEGMNLVTHGSQGTLRSYFRDFEISVAAKTGTAEEAGSRPSHSWFAGFAPSENPQIAVIVQIPFGESQYNPSIKIAKQVMIEYFGLNRKIETNTTFQNVLAR